MNLHGVNLKLFYITILGSAPNQVGQTAREQIAESKEHAASFRRTLEKRAKRFAALAKVEERHANHYRAALQAELARA